MGKMRIFKCYKNDEFVAAGSRSEIAKIVDRNPRYLSAKCYSSAGNAFKTNGYIVVRTDEYIESFREFKERNRQEKAKAKEELQKIKDAKLYHRGKKRWTFDDEVNCIIHHFITYGNYGTPQNPSLYKTALAERGYEFNTKYYEPKCFPQDLNAPMCEKGLWVLTMTKGADNGPDVEYHNVPRDDLDYIINFVPRHM